MGKSVAIRLATEGKAQVKSDFAEIAQSGDATAKRLIATYDEQAKAAERAAERASRTASKIAAIAPQSPRQFAVEVAAGRQFGADSEGSARRSAAAMKELLAQQERMEQQARQMIAAIDPLFAAQVRYDNEIARATELRRAGFLTEDMFQQKLRAEEAALEAVTIANLRNGQSMGARRAAMQQLGFQINDVTQGMALGVAPSVLFAQQASQVTQAIGLMSNGAKGFGAFMGGPWGIAIVAGISVLAMLIPKLLGTGDAVEEATEQLKKHAKEADAAREAQQRWITTTEGLIEASRKLEDQTKHLNESSRQAAQRAITEAANLAAKTVARRMDTKATLEAARAELELAFARERVAANDPRITQLGDKDSLAARIEALKKEIGGLDGAIARDQAALTELQIAKGRREGAAATDAGARANEDYADSLARIDEAFRKSGKSAADYKKMIDAVAEAERKRDADIDAARPSSNRESGRSVTSAEAAAIVRSMGGHVNSGDRSRAEQQRLYDAWVAAGKPADNPVAKPGTSAHERGNALDVQAGPGINAASLRRAFSAEGVSLTKTFRERGHWHIEWARAEGAARADNLRSQAEAMEESTRGALALAEAYLKSGEAAVRAEAQREGATDAIRSGADAEEQVRRQLNLDVAEGAANGAKAVAQMREETATRASLNDRVSSGAIAVADVNRVMAEEAALRPLLKLQALAQGDALTTLTKVVDAYRKALSDAHREEARGEALAAIDASARRVEDIRAMIGLADDPAARAIDDARRAAIREADAKGLKPTDIERTDLIDSRVEEAKAEAALRRADFIAREKAGQEDNLTLLQRELVLVGVNEQARERSLRLLSYELQLNRELGPEYADQIRQLLARADAEDTLRAEIEKTRASLDEARQIGADFVDTLFDPRNWKDWGDLGERILRDLEEDLIRLALLNPLKNWLLGEQNPTIASVASAFGDLLGGKGGPSGAGDGGISLFHGHPGSNAMGTEHFSGGLTWLAENGPELVELPRGAKVRPAAETRRLLGNGGARDVIQHFDLRGAVVTEDLYRQMEHTAARAVNDAAPEIAELGMRMTVDAYHRRMWSA